MSPEHCIALGLCPACGQPTEEGTCFNIYCPEGLENVQRELARGEAELVMLLDHDR